MKTVRITKPAYFDIFQTFDCGQCFRFAKVGENAYDGVAHDRYVYIAQKGDALELTTQTGEEETGFWQHFFDFHTDYEGMANTFLQDETLARAAHFANGIRLLRQDPWESLCSFIISQNNNIPRIKGIIRTLCCTFGKELCKDISGEAVYAFPTPQALYEAGTQRLFDLKTGFRAKYIFDAARTLCENPFFLTEIRLLSTKEAAEKLKTIHGVGDKVAACVLLFGFSRYDAFPVDVWVKRILETYYPNGTTPPLAGPFAGLAQQYLFYYERCKYQINM